VNYAGSTRNTTLVLPRKPASPSPNTQERIRLTMPASSPFIQDGNLEAVTNYDFSSLAKTDFSRHKHPTLKLSSCQECRIRLPQAG
jgi:hypothetical protein